MPGVCRADSPTICNVGVAQTVFLVNRGFARELQVSGKEKAHKHKQIFPVTARVGGGSPDRVARGLPTGGRGQKFMCRVLNLRNINIFVRVPGREDR